MTNWLGSSCRWHLRTAGGGRVRYPSEGPRIAQRRWQQVWPSIWRFLEMRWRRIGMHAGTLTYYLEMRLGTHRLTQASCTLTITANDEARPQQSHQCGSQHHSSTTAASQINEATAASRQTRRRRHNTKTTTSTTTNAPQQQRTTTCITSTTTRRRQQR